MYSKIKLISFDFDGTICPDSNNYLEFEKEFIKLLKEEYSLSNISREKRGEIKKKLDAEKWAEFKKEAKKSWMTSFKISNEIKENLAKLKEEYRLVIFSVASKKYICKILSNNGVEISLFENIYSTRDSFEGATKKEVWMFKEIANKEGLDVSECVHVGDNEYDDYLTSKEAGFKAFLVDNSHLNKVKIGDLRHLLNKTTSKKNQEI